jgi:hypothetical protein
MKVTKSACSSSDPCSGFGDASGCISNSQLKSLGIGNHKLQTDAANAFIKMYSDMPSEIKSSVKLSDSYRPLNVQCKIFDFDHYEKTGKKRKKGTAGTAAAYPGSSNHGWGRAIDISPSNVQKWIKENGEKYGWTWGEGKAVGEPWHFTFCGSGPNRDKNCDSYLKEKITVDTSAPESDDTSSQDQSSQSSQDKKTKDFSINDFVSQITSSLGISDRVSKGSDQWKKFFGFKDQPTTSGSSKEGQTLDSDQSSQSSQTTSISDYKITKPAQTDDEFYSQVLKKIGAPESPQNLLFFYAWRQAEGAKSTFNPFNTTQKKEGSSFWNCLKRKEGKCLGGVRNYKSESDGIDATAQTLMNGNYGCIVNGLKKDIGAINIATNCSSDLKKWGTGEGIKRTLTTKNIAPPAISTSKVKEINEELIYEIHNIKNIMKKVL